MIMINAANPIMVNQAVAKEQLHNVCIYSGCVASV